MNKPNILYISFTGMGEALGKSQVLEYLYGLSKDHNIHLISFERQKDLEETDSLREEIESHNISWTSFIYSNKYGSLSSLKLVLLGAMKCLQLSKKNNVDIIHARSMIPALMGYPSKLFFKTKLLFDIRSFSTDEKVDRNRITKNSLMYKVLMYLEVFLYKNSNFIVTLTNKSKNILNCKYNIPLNKMKVISTCASSTRFYPIKDKSQLKKELHLENTNKILLHSGSVTGWYLFEEEVVFFKKLKKIVPDLTFLILNEHAHPFIHALMDKHNILGKDYLVASAPFSDMNLYLNISDASIFFIKPYFSKAASAPTKFAEHVSAKLPSITNKDVGDMEELMTKYDVGVIVDIDNISSQNIDEAAHMILSNTATEDYERLFSDHFDKNKAILEYSNIYSLLSSSNNPNG